MTLAQQFILCACLGYMSIWLVQVGSVLAYPNPPELTTNPHVHDGVVDILLDNQRVVVPLYDPAVTHEQYSEERWKLDQAINGEHVNFMAKVAEATLDRKKRVSVFAPAVYFAKFVMMMTYWMPKYYFVLRRHKESPPVTANYIAQNTVLWDQIVAESKKYPLEGKGNDEEATIKRELNNLNNLLEVLKTVTYVSPTGSYMRWDLATIDGVTVAQRAGPILATFHRNGYGWVTSLANRNMKFLRRLNSGETPAVPATLLRSLPKSERSYEPAPIPDLSYAQAQAQADVHVPGPSVLLSEPTQAPLH